MAFDGTLPCALKVLSEQTDVCEDIALPKTVRSHVKQQSGHRKSKEQPDTQYWFVTNDFKLSAKEICDYYNKRWDIEVFFRFVRQ